MPLNRLIAPARAGSPTTVFGRVYPQTPGAVYDAPTGDVGTLTAAGFTFVALSGSTAQRPSQGVAIAGVDGLQAGLEYFDVSLGICIFYDGLTWRNPATGASV